MTSLVLLAALAGGQQSDIADVPNRDLKIGGDSFKRYFLIGPMKETKKTKLLLVLPGGDGSAAFNPFICRVVKNALPEDMAVAQLVAPVWSPKQGETIVWPTRINGFPGMKFTTEDFIDAAIDDASKQLSIDPAQIYLMAWSSSGPPTYAYTLAEKKRTRGAFVAMSIFRNDIIPKEPKAEGGRFYILHSPEDFIPISHAEAARDKIKGWGGTVEYKTYKGGHGWHGDIFGSIRTAVAWLVSK